MLRSAWVVIISRWNLLKRIFGQFEKKTQCQNVKGPGSVGLFTVVFYKIPMWHTKFVQHCCVVLNTFLCIWKGHQKLDSAMHIQTSSVTYCLPILSLRYFTELLKGALWQTRSAHTWYKCKYSSLSHGNQNVCCQSNISTPLVILIHVCWWL